MAAAYVGTSASGMTTGDVKRAFDFSVSDFATIVTTTAYVDKSLMIRDFYNVSSRILITAPPRFGKSTNLDMIKRFFEIEMDSNGEPKTIHTTNNYKLFMDYSLEICKDIKFFNEHFGKHPVVYIDFKPLGRVYESAKILDTFKIIIENSFDKHRYILKSSKAENVCNGIAGFNVNFFRKYVSCGITNDVDLVDLTDSFKHLSTVLKRFFEKKVFILIDNYDAFLDTYSLTYCSYRTGGENIVVSSISQLLNNTDCVERVLITGVIPTVIGEGLPSGVDNVERYHFLDSHPFTKYYGLTSAEVDMVLSNVIKCDEERRDIKNTINEYYNAYESYNRHIRVYNILSVLKYVCRRRVTSYWCEMIYVNKFKYCFKIESIRQKLQTLLLGNELQLDISQPLSTANFFIINQMITGIKVEHLSIEMELFFVLFYHFGFLSFINDLGMGVVCVNIPSEEIKNELAKAVFDVNRAFYSSPHVNGILSALDAIQPDATELYENCDTFRKNMYNLYLNITFPIGEIIEFLYVNLVSSAKYRRVMGRTLGPNGPMAVLLKNRHQVAICVTYDGSGSAENAHQTVINNTDGNPIFEVFDDVRGKVVIVIDSNGRIAYSYDFKTGDNLRKVRTLRKIRTL